MRPRSVSAASGFDVLGLGVVAVDELLYVDEFPRPESKTRVRLRLRQCGGLTGTALVAAARLGARCAYAGRLGDDDDSRFVKACLESEGIDVSRCAPCAAARPAVSTIIVDQRRKTRTVLCSLDGEAGPAVDHPDAELLRAARVLLVDHHGVEGTLRAVRLALEHGVAVVADFERHPGPGFDELLGLVDHPILSERFARELTGTDDGPTAAERLWTPRRETVVVTAGPRGGWFVDESTGGRAAPFPAFEVDVVDTPGCGDVFHGAYAAALAAGENVERRVAVARAAAALKATRHGGQAGCPSRDAVERLLCGG